MLAEVLDSKLLDSITEDRCTHSLCSCSVSSSLVSNETCVENKANDIGEISSSNVRTSKLKCFYTNARSLVNKLDELNLYLIEEKPDIIGITETWLNSSIDDSELKADGYAVFRRDRDNKYKQRGGGVLLLVKEHFNAELRDDLYDNNFPECIWCSIEVNKINILVGVCYRPPDTDQNCVEALINIINKASKHRCLILGDFNFPHLDWLDDSKLDDDHNFVKCINNNFLYQKVDKPTRGDNILDLIFVPDNDLVDNLEVGEPFANSDHYVLRFDLIIEHSIVSKNVKPVFDYFKADYDLIRDELKTLDLDNVVDKSSVESFWNTLKSEIIKVRDKYVGIRKSKKNKKQKWVTKKVIRFRRAKVKAWKAYRASSGDPELYNRYKDKLKLSQSAISEAKKQFEQELANNIKRDSKSFFSYVNSKKLVSSSIGQLRDSLGNLVTDDKKRADIFNEYFATVFTTEDKSNIPEPEQVFLGSVTDELVDIKITPEMVRSKLDELNVNKSSGPDGLHPKLLYEIKNEVAKPLAELFILSLESGTVPLEWKLAVVTPLHKKGNKNDPQNYRPISLTSILCKILESIIKDSIVEHLDKFSLVRDSQHGFRKGRSCLTNLLDYMEEVTCLLDDDKPVDVIYLDFAKAFDKVPHCRLLKKVRAHGIRGKVISWIEDWLDNRVQCVVLNNSSSDRQLVLSGVPQGSVLGPLLFLIYINDLDLNVISKLFKFADDSKVCKSINSDLDRDILRSDLDKIFKWSESWQMSFNIDKCVVLHVGNNNQQFDYYLGNNLIKTSNKERDLGVIVDNSCKFSEQCRMAASAANKLLGLIKRSIEYKNKDTIVRLYKALVRPKLEYCIQAWCPYLKKDVAVLERVQKRATRMISGLHNLSYSDRLKECKLLPLDKRRERGDLIQTFKFLKGVDRVDYNRFFTLNIGNKTRGHSLKLGKSRSRLDIRKNFFSQRVVNSWNKLPQGVIDAKSVNCFKNRLDKLDF